MGCLETCIKGILLSDSRHPRLHLTAHYGGSESGCERGRDGWEGPQLPPLRAFAWSSLTTTGPSADGVWRPTLASTSAALWGVGGDSWQRGVEPAVRLFVFVYTPLPKPLLADIGNLAQRGGASGAFWDLYRRGCLFIFDSWLFAWLLFSLNRWTVRTPHCEHQQ